MKILQVMGLSGDNIVGGANDCDDDGAEFVIHSGNSVMGEKSILVGGIGHMNEGCGIVGGGAGYVNGGLCIMPGGGNNVNTTGLSVNGGRSCVNRNDLSVNSGDSCVNRVSSCVNVGKIFVSGGDKNIPGGGSYALGGCSCVFVLIQFGFDEISKIYAGGIRIIRIVLCSYGG